MNSSEKIRTLSWLRSENVDEFAQRVIVQEKLDALSRRLAALEDELARSRARSEQLDVQVEELVRLVGSLLRLCLDAVVRS